MPSSNPAPSKVLFWGCFIALITTSFAFITRMILCAKQFKSDFALDDVSVGALQGAGVWPFGISIILFSLVIDKIGYRVAMFFSFLCYAAYLTLACLAYAVIQGKTGTELAAAQQTGLNYLTWGSIILALGNGTVEAFINPVVATMFRDNKTKWLNILHAGWPGGLVIAGIMTIVMFDVYNVTDWRLVLGLIAIPAVTYLLMLSFISFPQSEREQAGVSYREMLGEFGAFGALVGFGLIFLQLGSTLQQSSPELDQKLTAQIGPDWALYLSGIMTAVVVLLFGVYTRSLGRGIMAFLIVIMMPLATTEIGTDGWITGLMEGPMEAEGLNPAWVLVYTSAIMMVLRFFAGPIVHTLSPIGLLAVSAALAIAGLLALSQTGGAGLFAIVGAATLYGFGKTFFWPTMLGVTAEQCPKGGALTLNAISGIGMVAVGVLGFPFIGYLQEDTSSSVLRQNAPQVAEKVLVDKTYMSVEYKAIDPAKAQPIKTGEAPGANEAEAAALKNAAQAGQFNALAKMAAFPGFMLVCYLILFLYFKAKGGYQAQVLTGHAAQDERFTGGVAGPADA